VGRALEPPTICGFITSVRLFSDQEGFMFQGGHHGGRCSHRHRHGATAALVPSAWRRAGLGPIGPGLAGVALGVLSLVACSMVRPVLAADEFGPGFSMARLKYDGGGDWYSNPSSLPNLAKALRERTSVPVDRIDEVRVSLLDPDLFNYPYVYMNGHGNVRLSDAEVARLRAYLRAGGFLFADDNYGMDESFRREMARVFPEKKLIDVPFDHPIYHSFYDLPAGPPKVHEHDGKPSEGLGIFDGSRLMVFYTYQADIGDGIEDPEVHKDPPEIREQAMKMAVNTAVYALSK
jgi:hypothetical protein